VENGVINDAVLQAFLETQTPTNGPAYETWMMKQIQDKECAAAAAAAGSSSLRNVGAAKNLPHKWRRYSRVCRHDERNDIY
jgi:hypothetical protein